MPTLAKFPVDTDRAVSRPGYWVLLKKLEFTPESGNVDTLCPSNVISNNIINYGWTIQLHLCSAEL